MLERVTRTALFALHQATLAVAIVMMPLALLARRAGVTLPLGRLVERTERAYRAGN